MTMHDMTKTLITYGSRYGSAKHYAQEFSALTGFPVLPFQEAASTKDYDRVIHFGALYAGGVLGLRQIVSRLADNAELIIVTVGLADVQDTKNTRNIKKLVYMRLPEDVLQRTGVFHLRGAIDYGKLSLKHRTMMALLYAKAKGMPEERKTAETRAMLETYGKQVSFVDDAALLGLKDCLFK